jgi:hypothetical protein
MPAKKPTRKPDLRKRLDEIRAQNTSQNSVALIITLDSPLYDTLERLAADQNQTPAACAADLIAAALRDLAEDENI